MTIFGGSLKKSELKNIWNFWKRQRKVQIYLSSYPLSQGYLNCGLWSAGKSLKLEIIRTTHKL